MAVVEGKAVVSIDGAQAGQQLDLLEKKTLELRRALVELKSQPVLDNKKIKETEKELSLTRKEMQALKLATKDYSTTLKNLSGASLRELEAAARQLSRETRNLKRDTDEYKRAAGDLSRVKAEMAKVRQEMNAAGVQTKTFGSKLREVGSYMFAGGGIIAAFTFLISVVRNAFQTITEFGKKVSELQAITGASGADLDFLKNKAKDLAAQYGKSASEIVEAMKMVGSAKPELLENVDALSQVTEAVLTLSQASGMDLATSTSSLTTIMNQFGHSASMANEDINILAAGSKFGAVEVDYLAESISKVGTIAAAAGLSLEQTTAVMELFGEKGVKAETAGRGFKTILTELQKDTRNYTNGVFDLNKAIDNNQSIAGDNLKLQKKFGTEFFGLAQILFQNKERFLELNRQVTGTNTAFEQAAIATDNLSGDLAKASGTWDSFVLSLEDGNGIISRGLRNVVNGFSDLLVQLKILNDTDATFWEKTEASLRTYAKLIPGMGTAIDRFKTSWDKLFGEEETTAKKKNLIGIFDGESMIKQTQMMQEQLKIAEELKRKAAEEGAQLTEEEIEAQKKKNEAITKANQDLMAQIEAMNIALIDDARERDLAELDSWKQKEIEKINASEASAKVKYEALEALELTYLDKFSDIEEKYIEIDVNRKKKEQEEELKHAEKIRAIREEYGLVTNEEKLAEEIAILEEYFAQKLLTEEEYEIARVNLIAKYRTQETSEIRSANDEKGKSDKDYFKMANDLANASADLFASAKEQELIAAGDNEEKKKQIMKKYADIEFAIRIAQIITATAKAVMETIANPALAAIVAATGAIQLGIATAQRANVQGLAEGGTFGVTRSQDGRRFNASYGGNGTGYYSKPTVLVAEEGPEFVVSNKSLKVPAFKRAVDAIDSYQRGQSMRQLNYDGLISSMNNIKGFAEGGFLNSNQASLEKQTSSLLSDALLVEFQTFRSEISNWQKSLKSYVVYDDIEAKGNELNSLRTEITM